MSDAATELKEAGTALYKAGEFARAGGKYAEALEKLPAAPASAEDEESRQKLRLNLAQCYLKLASFRAAEALCDAVLAADPLNAKATFRRGQARLGCDALHDALADFLAACKLDPKSRELRAEYDELRQMTTAHPALAHRLDDLRVVEEKALRQLHTGRTDEALRTFGLMQRECDSENVEVQLPGWEARAALGAGAAHRHAGRRSEAREAFERALDRAVSEHARAPVLAVYATIALCLAASDAPPGAQAERARAQLSSAVVAAEGLGDGLLAAAAHGAMACALLRADRPADALAHARNAALRSAAAGDAHGEAVDMVTRATVARRLAAVGAPEAAAEAEAAGGANAQLARALEIARALKYTRVEAEALGGLARLRLADGRVGEAAEFGEEALRLSRAYKLPGLEVGALATFGSVSLAHAERRLAPPDGVDLPAADVLFARAAELSARGEDAEDGGGRLALPLRAHAHGARLQRCAAEADGGRRGALALELRGLLARDVSQAREMGLVEVRAEPLSPIFWGGAAHSERMTPQASPVRACVITRVGHANLTSSALCPPPAPVRCQVERLCLGHCALACLLCAEALPAIEYLQASAAEGRAPATRRSLARASARGAALLWRGGRTVGSARRGARGPAVLPCAPRLSSCPRASTPPRSTPPALPCAPQAALSLGGESGEYEGRDDHLANLGVVHASLGAYVQAADYFEQAGRSALVRGVDPWKRACHAGRLGMALAAGGEHERACVSLLQAVHALGGEASASAMLGLATEMQAEGRSADAAHLLEQAFLLLRYGPDARGPSSGDARTQAA